MNDYSILKNHNVKHAEYICEAKTVRRAQLVPSQKKSGRMGYFLALFMMIAL